MRVNRRLALSIAGAALLSTALFPAWGAMRPLTLVELVTGAPLILTGQVTAISDGYRTEWPGIGKVVCSDVSIRIERIWRGQHDAEVIVLQNPGGRLRDGRRVVCSEAPAFAIGEQVLVFCARYQGKDAVYSWDQGKYAIDGDRVIGKPDYAIGETIDLREAERRVRAHLEKGG